MYRASMVADNAAREGFAIGCTGVLVPPMGVNAEPLSALVLISAAKYRRPGFGCIAKIGRSGGSTIRSNGRSLGR